MECLRPDLLAQKPYNAAVVPHVLKLDANEHPQDLPEWFKKKLSLVWEKGIQSNRYPDGGHASLKEAIAAYAGVPSSWVSIGNGSDELIRSLIIATCLGGRGSVMVAEPTFSMYAITAAALGVPVVKVDRDRDTFGLDLVACDQALTAAAPPVRLLFLTSPNAPTGNLLNATELAWLRTLPDSILVVIDEAYFEFCQTTVLPTLPANWVVLRTFSKAFRLAGHRVGYAVAQPQVSQVLELLRLPYNLPSVSQWAVQLALEHAPELLADLPTFSNTRKTVYAALQAMPGVRVWPSEANYLYFRTEQPLAEVQQHLLAQGISIRLTGGGLRVSIGTPEDMESFVAALQRCLSPALVP